MLKKKLFGIIIMLVGLMLVFAFVSCPEVLETLKPGDEIVSSTLSGTVTITGNAQVGQILTANTSALGGSGTISYQWKRGINNIGTSNTYIVQSGDFGSNITLTVTRSGISGSVTSLPLFIGSGLNDIPDSQATEGLHFTFIEFTFIGSAYSVSRGTAIAAEVVIPSFYNGLPVIWIEPLAFINYINLTNITIPNSVRFIGDYAFSGCTSLTNVTIGNSVTSIGSGAFSGCTSLVSVTIPNSVTSIGNSAFSGCTSLTNVTIGNSVTSIGSSAFLGCTSLTNITIPNSVTSIDASAFHSCTSLTSITIPNSVTSIGAGAFGGCTSLISITIPNSLTIIGVSLFWNCTSLTSITIPNSVTSIGNGAFTGCTSLTNVTFVIGSNISSDNFHIEALGGFVGNIGDLRSKYLNVGGGAGTYTRASGGLVWTKQ
ncbi:MAG: leucine-rich repeat domain-containing protein [Treponema sp.]|nr:leucine-rich repeat domain-containing protein [Treponema sp.]